MTQLVWDAVGDRTFQMGLDRGVLYPRDGDAVVWNGLTQIAEEVSREVKSYWVDGVKYLDHHVPGAYSAKLSAFTYPDVLEQLMGTEQFAPGVNLHDQSAQVFHLSYRTFWGNDLHGVDLGYRLHILYNVMATQDDATFNTLAQQGTPSSFSWKLSGTPPTMYGARPTSHISLDSMGIDSDLLTQIEALLYGTEDDPPALPTMIELLDMIENA